MMRAFIIGRFDVERPARLYQVIYHTHIVFLLQNCWRPCLLPASDCTICSEHGLEDHPVRVAREEVMPVSAIRALSHLSRVAGCFRSHYVMVAPSADASQLGQRSEFVNDPAIAVSGQVRAGLCYVGMPHRYMYLQLLLSRERWRTLEAPLHWDPPPAASVRRARVSLFLLLRRQGTGGLCSCSSSRYALQL